MAELNHTERTKQDDAKRANRKPNPSTGLNQSQLLEFSYTDSYPFAAELLVHLIMLCNEGFFFKLGTSLKGNGFLLSIGKAGQSMRYEAFSSPEELDNIVTILQSL